MAVSFTEVESRADDLVRSAMAIHPDLPAANLAQAVADSAESEFIGALSTVLVNRYLLRVIRAQRREQSAESKKPSQLPLPGFEHLPVRIAANAKGGKRVYLRDATYTQVRSYYRALARKHRERRRNDPKFAEAKTLMERMQKRSKRHRGITVAEVVGVELPTER